MASLKLPGECIYSDLRKETGVAQAVYAQVSVISYQLSAISYQLSIISYQLSVNPPRLLLTGCVCDASKAQ